MTKPITVRTEKGQRIIEAMSRVAEKRRAEGVPRCYYWRAVWWRLHARMVTNPEEVMKYSENQLALYKGMEADPAYYRRKPYRYSHYEWFQKKEPAK